MENKEELRKGVVVEALPNTLFLVRDKETEEESVSYLAGKMKLYRIKVLVGDTVMVKPDSYGGRGRIVKRL